MNKFINNVLATVIHTQSLSNAPIQHSYLLNNIINFSNHEIFNLYDVSNLHGRYLAHKIISQKVNGDFDGKTMETRVFVK